MDLASHIFIGAAIGQVTIGKKAGKKAMFWGALAGIMPDFDVVFQSLFSAVRSVFFHRGITHSLFFWIIFSILFAWICWKKVLLEKGITYKEWLRLWSIAWFSHLFVDLFNTYGTGYLLPFSGLRPSFDTINVIDLVFTMPLLIAFVLLIFIHRNRSRNILATIGLFCSFTYLSYTVYNKYYFDNFAKKELEKQSISYTRIRTSPLPLSNFAWMVLAEGEEGFWIGNYFMTEGGDIHFQYIPKNHQLIDFENSKEYSRLQTFTKGYYVVDKMDDKIILSDARFTSLANINSYPDSNIEFVLRFVITEKDGKIKVKRAIPNRKINLKTFSEYYHKIFKRA